MLGFNFVDSFFAEVHKLELKSCFVPYHFYSKICKNTGTPGKFNTYRKTLEALIWNFVKLHPRCCCQSLVEFHISVVLLHFCNKRINFGMLTLHLWTNLTWGLTYCDPFYIHSALRLEWLDKLVTLHHYKWLWTRCTVEVSDVYQPNTILACTRSLLTSNNQTNDGICIGIDVLLVDYPQSCV